MSTFVPSTGSDGVSAEGFRDLMSCFPTGVAVVATLDLRGQPKGMTCSSLAAVCLDPPTLLVCLRTDSRTQAALARRLTFSVNVLHAQGRMSAQVFSSPVEDRFAGIRWQPSPHGLPWLVDDAAAIADCRVTDQVPMGDHTVVFGEVIAVAVDGDSSPLIYGKRQYAQWRPDPVTPWLPAARRRQ
jgi:flavin reductase (NADH)